MHDAAIGRFLIRSAALLILLVPLGALAAEGAAVSDRTENLVSVRVGALAALPAGAIPASDAIPAADALAVAPPGRLFVVGGRAVVMGPGSSWILAADEKTWTHLDWRPPAEVLAVASDGREAYLILGGETGNAGQRIERVTLTAGTPVLRTLPPLPQPLSSPRGGVRSGSLYVAGTDADGALTLLSLSTAAPQASWATLAESPNETGSVTSVVAQNSAVYVTMRGGQNDRLLRWRAGEGWSALGELRGLVLRGTARALGQAHVMYLVAGGSGADNATAADVTAASENASATSENASTAKLMTFHTITRSWATMAELPAADIIGGAGWKDGMVWLQPAASGKGIETATAQLEPRDLLIQIPDWIVIIVYLAGMTGIGLYFYLREKRQSTVAFFVGGRAIPFWAAGVSLYATNTSSISYIAIPAKAFETNWQYLTNNLVAVIGLIFVAIWVVPLLRRLDLMSVFHYLEMRFHPAIRTIASALCILVQIGSRLSVILFLPALAIATMTGLDVVWCILIMGGITIAYTALGGMKAVIWTDFAQLFVMFGGALFAIGFIVLHLDGGMGDFLAATVPEGKMKLLDFSFDLTEATVWGFVFLVVFDVVLTFPKDQVLMQRVLSTRSAKEAGRSVWMFAAIMIPGGFLFYFIGTALYVFYQSHPERLNPLMSLDATFPLFIAAELPVGVTGLIIAGILAASMSTLSSILNSVATLVSVDFYEKLVKNPDPATSVRFAEAMTVVVGLIGIGAAYLLSRYDIHSLFDVSIELAGLLGGGFAGAYTLGMLTRRANWQGVSIGIGAAIALTTLAWSMDLVHPYFYLAISILVCIVVGYLASYLFPPSAQSLAGLTIYGEKPGAPSFATD